VEKIAGVHANDARKKMKEITASGKNTAGKGDLDLRNSTKSSRREITRDLFRWSFSMKRFGKCLRERPAVGMEVYSGILSRKQEEPTHTSKSTKGVWTCHKKRSGTELQMGNQGSVDP
jgi:hypothetical protein